MNKSPSSITFIDYKNNITNSDQTHFGNDWGLFIEIESINKNENYDKNIYINNNLETIYEDDDMNEKYDNDIESNTINTLKNVKQKEKKINCVLTCVKIITTTIVSCLLTYIIFYIL